MKKAIITVMAAVASAISATAVPLFPYFCDMAGTYNEGAPEELAVLGLPIMYSASPSFFSTAKEAESFLQDVLPISSYPISESSIDGFIDTTIKVYSSPMEDGKVSHLYLITLPSGKFYAAYSETAESDTTAGNGSYFTK